MPETEVGKKWPGMSVGQPPPLLKLSFLPHLWIVKNAKHTAELKRSAGTISTLPLRAYMTLYLLYCLPVRPPTHLVLLVYFRVKCKLELVSVKVCSDIHRIQNHMKVFSRPFLCLHKHLSMRDIQCFKTCRIFPLCHCAMCHISSMK